MRLTRQVAPLSMIEKSYTKAKPVIKSKPFTTGLLARMKAAGGVRAPTPAKLREQQVPRLTIDELFSEILEATKCNDSDAQQSDSEVNNEKLELIMKAAKASETAKEHR